KIQNRNNIEWGTYHYCGQGITSWHGFAKAIFDIAKHITSLKIKHVEPVSSDAFASKATRPDFSALDCQRIKKHFGIHTKSWRQSLEIMINRLFNE
ncbi:MAG: sugar nucleotide-binding protein, partial [Deltaproteobacteria bacterium]|nr:sugar nucleotide-binding protein [Deltaproteobacteria bacterium]